MSYFDGKVRHIKTEKADFIVPERMRSARILRGMEKKEAAEKLGISEFQLGLMENGHQLIPKEFIFNLMTVYCIGKEYFYELQWERV
jgi:DNA-binding XRE family transcriptional regulator